jgi:hypothetical protein
VTTYSSANAAAARRGFSLPRSAEVWFVALALLATMLIPFIGKYQSADAPESSPLVETIWTLMYLGAGIRLWQMRDVAVTLFKRSLPLLGFLALMFASSLWSVETTTIKKAIELAGTTAIGYYIVARFSLRDLLNILIIAFGVAGVASVAVIFGAPAHGRMDFGSGAWTGIFQEKNNLGAAMALAGISLFVLLFEPAKPKPPAAVRERAPGAPQRGLLGEAGFGALWVLLLPFTLFNALGRRRALTAGVFVLAMGLLAGSASATSLGAYAGVTLLLVTIWACRSKRFGLAARILTVAALVLGPLACLTFGLTPQSLFDLLGRESNLTGRTDFWPYLQQAISERPILGYGYDAFFRSQEGLDTLSYYVVEAGGWSPYHAHNSFLQILLDSGYVGLSVFGLVLLCAFWQSLVYAFRESERVALWPLAILLYLFLGSFTETYYRSFNTIEWVVFVTAVLYPVRPRAQAATPNGPADPLEFTSRDRLRRSSSGQRSARDRDRLRETA